MTNLLLVVVLRRTTDQLDSNKELHVSQPCVSSELALAPTRMVIGSSLSRYNHAILRRAMVFATVSSESLLSSECLWLSLIRSRLRGAHPGATTYDSWYRVSALSACRMLYQAPAAKSRSTNHGETMYLCIMVGRVDCSLLPRTCIPASRTAPFLQIIDERAPLRSS